MPISEPSPIVQPCSITWWPTVTLRPMVHRHARVDVQHGAVLHVAAVADDDRLRVARGSPRAATRSCARPAPRGRSASRRPRRTRTRAPAAHCRESDIGPSGDSPSCPARTPSAKPESSHLRARRSTRRARGASRERDLPAPATSVASAQPRPAQRDRRAPCRGHDRKRRRAVADGRGREREHNRARLRRGEDRAGRAAAGDEELARDSPRRASAR